jgi:hypothetical protein
VKTKQNAREIQIMDTNFSLNAEMFLDSILSIMHHLPRLQLKVIEKTDIFTFLIKIFLIQLFIFIIL